MLKIDPVGSSQPVFRDPGALGLASGARVRPAVHSHAEILVRRLRYYIDLLQTGYRHALRPDPLPRSLRSERIALGIDLPELDTVPLWSGRREDGAVSLPFIEFILGQIGETLEGLARSVVDDPSACDALLEGRRELQAVQETIDPAGGTSPALPRLRDLYLRQEIVGPLCGPDGLLERQRGTCAALLPAEAPVSGH
ncbi:MAG: hypothetical protein ACRD6R_10630 [Candidatus Polarisedimenticolia bacterium]